MVLLPEKALRSAGIATLIVGLLVTPSAYWHRTTARAATAQKADKSVWRSAGNSMKDSTKYGPTSPRSARSIRRAMVFYPLTLSFDPPNGAVAFVPGFRNACFATNGGDLP